MAHKDINDHILFPFLISCGAIFAIVFAFANVEYRGQPMGNNCINECYEQLLERREAAELAKLE